MINFDEITAENTQKHNPHWPQILNHQYKIVIVGGSGSGKTNPLLNLIHHQPKTDKIFSYAKNPFDPKYQYLV